jgi:hypothetical protein
MRLTKLIIGRSFLELASKIVPVILNIVLMFFGYRATLL